MSRWLSPDQAGLYCGPGLFGGDGIVVTPIRWPPVVHSSVHEAERLKAIAYTDGALGPIIAPTYDGQSRKSRRERWLRKIKFAEQEGKCFWCFGPMSMICDRVTESGRLKHNGTYASFEHYIPLECGGSKDDENIVLSHSACNGWRKKRRFNHDPIYGNGGRNNLAAEVLDKMAGS